MRLLLDIKDLKIAYLHDCQTPKMLTHIDPSTAEATLFQVNPITAEVLAPCITMSSAAMVLTM